MSAFRLALVTLLACLWCVGLLVLRLKWSGQMSFYFMSWNLFLAAVPLGFSLALLKVRHGLLGLPVIGGWLLFFPNAPYVLTDLVHLKQRGPVALWFDLLLLLSFALVALWMGFQSLRLVQGWVAQRTSSWTAWAFAMASLLLSGFGIYLGRFLRWNSWDIVHRPEALVNDIVVRIINPLAHTKTWGVTLGFGGLLVVAYVFWITTSVAPAPVRAEK
ncbi:MAG TPA: DUF1361 domain-containing protein [Prosthecobacter sp.]|nr:DUF1361 domain-containing protein [Prosthecobacter sp.]